MDPISFRIMWSRLVGVAEEAAAALRHAAFSSIVSEGNDCSAVLFDERGLELAEPLSYTATSFIGTLPRTMSAFLAAFPRDRWRPGDVLISNDPWIGTGHMFDISIASPIFHGERLVAFSATCSHTPHIGGNGGRIDSRTVFEEGLRLPPMWLYREGRRVDALFDVVGANVPKPEQVLGDIAAQVAAHAVIARRVREIMDETRRSSWVDFGDELHSTCRSAMARAIAAIPDGTYRHEIEADGLDTPIRIACALTVAGDRMVIDFSGSSPQVPSSINSPFHYTLARAYYAVKALLLRTIPNNEATFRPIEVTAPEGCVLNPRFPVATANRHLLGHYVPAAVIGALNAAVPQLSVADGSGPAWTMAAAGEKDGHPFQTYVIFGAGQGASARGQGMDAVTYPGNAANTPIEVLEQETSLLVRSKALRRDSGGTGRRRGGWGERIVLSTTTDARVAVSLTGDRTRIAAGGSHGGGPGRTGAMMLNGRPISPKGSVVLASTDELDIETPGGGGFGVA